MSPKTHHLLLKLWHAWVAGGFLVAYVTADEDTYAMHLFAGYAVLAAIAIRLLVGVLAPGNSPLRLSNPFAASKRNPLFAWLAAGLLASVGLAAATGALADGHVWLEKPHELVAEASLWVIFAHLAFVTFIYGGKRILFELKEKFQ
jgi:cytochrome b